MRNLSWPSRLRRIGVTLIVVSAAFLLFQVSLRWGADYYLRERARLPVRVGRLFINPATSRVTLGLKGSQPDQVLLLDLGQVRFDWWTVFLKRLRIGSVVLRGIQLDIDRHADGSMVIGGIDLPAGNPEEKAAAASAPPSPAKPWGIGVGGIDLKDIALRYRDPKTDLHLVIRSFKMAPAESWHPRRASPFEGDFLINGGTLTLRGSAFPFREDPSIEAQIHLNGLPLGWMLPLVRDQGIKMLSGTLSATAQVYGSYSKTGTITARWNGPVEFTEAAAGGPAIGLSEARFTGALSLEDLSVEISSAAAPQVRARAIAMAAPDRLTLADRSLKPAFRWTLSPIELRVENIDTASPATISRLKFTALPSRFEKIAADGRWALLSKVPDGDIHLTLDGLNLTPFSPFVEKAIGWKIKSGLLDHKTDATFDRGKLESQNGFTAHAFYMDKLGKEDLQSETDQLGLPIGLALTLLRDADDNIRLEVPVAGDLSDPQVPKWNLLWTVLGKAGRAAVRAAVTAFFPSGTHIGFDPIVFAPGQSALSPEGSAYVAKTAEKLIERPQVTLKVTGYAVTEDAYVVLRKKKVKGQALDLNALSEKEKEKMSAVAAARAEAIQTRFAEAGIDPKRILISPASVDGKKDALPRAELSL